MFGHWCPKQGLAHNPVPICFNWNVAVCSNGEVQASLSRIASFFFALFAGNAHFSVFTCFRCFPFFKTNVSSHLVDNIRLFVYISAATQSPLECLMKNSPFDECASKDKDNYLIIKASYSYFSKTCDLNRLYE